MSIAIDWLISQPRLAVWLVNFVLACLAIEALVLVVNSRHAWPAWRDVIPSLLAGAFLMMALRSALVGTGIAVLALCLAAAGLCHVADLRRRWRATSIGPAARRHAHQATAHPSVVPFRRAP